jgi:hypothetical protein
MPAAKEKVLVKAESSPEIFTVSLTKRMASFLKTLLPERYTLQIRIGYRKKNELNTSLQVKK